MAWVPRPPRLSPATRRFPSADWHRPRSISRTAKLRVLAVLNKTRSRMLPDVPTMAESGYHDMEADSWVGVLVPKRTPKEIISILNREIVKIIAVPDIRERLAGLGFDAVGTTQEEFAAQIKTETEKWAKVIQAGNIKPQ